MFNLIKRDVIMQKKLLLTFIPFILFFVVADKHPAFIFLIASIFIPFNAFAYDGEVKTNLLLNTLPYTRKKIIASRYLGAVIYMVLSIGAASVTLIVADKTFTINDILIASGLFLIFAALTFPLFYIFKPNYIFFIVMISFIILAGIGPPVVMFLAKRLPTIIQFINSLTLPILYTSVTLIIMMVYALSWGITTVIYERKAF